MSAPLAPLRNGLADAVDWFATRRHGLAGLAVVRAALGFLILLDLALQLPRRHEIWGGQGWYTPTHMERDMPLGISLFRLSDAAWATDLILLLVAVVVGLFMLGVRTTLTTPALLFLVWSLHERNPVVLNGGDNLLRIMLFYLMFATLDGYLSRGACERREKMAQREGTQVLRTVLHNAAWVACIGQLCVLYLASGMFKVQGEMWQEGTAVYYVTRVAEFNVWPEVTALLVHSPLLITVATYTAVLAQIAFPFCLMNRHARHLLFVVLAGMHVGIGVLMGLPIFSGVMIACDLLLFSTDEWRTAARFARQARDRVLARLGAARPASDLAPLPAPVLREGIPA